MVVVGVGVEILAIPVDNRDKIEPHVVEMPWGWPQSSKVKLHYAVLV